MDISADLTRIALAEDGELKELYYESKREESLVGNVYAGACGKCHAKFAGGVCRHRRGEKRLLLLWQCKSRSDAEKNSARPKVGDTLLLQVEKDAVGTKGAVLTGHFSFPGKFLVLLPEEAAKSAFPEKLPIRRSVRGFGKF